MSQLADYDFLTGVHRLLARSTLMTVLLLLGMFVVSLLAHIGIFRKMSPLRHSEEAARTSLLTNCLGIKHGLEMQPVPLSWLQNLSASLGSIVGPQQLVLHLSKR